MEITAGRMNWVLVDGSKVSMTSRGENSWVLLGRFASGATPDGGYGDEICK